MYLIIWIRPVFNEASSVFIRYIFQGKFTVSLAFKVSFPQVIPILLQSRLENMGASLSGCIILAIQLELIYENYGSLIINNLESMGQSKTILLVSIHNHTYR